MNFHQILLLPSTLGCWALSAILLSCAPGDVAGSSSTSEVVGRATGFTWLGITNNQTNSKYPKLQFQSSSTATISFFTDSACDGGSVASAEIVAGQTNTVELTLPNSGEYTIYYNLSNSSKISSCRPTSLSIDADFTAPALTQNVASNPLYTTSTSITIGGTCEIGLNVTIESSTTETVTCAGDGTWTTTIALGSSDGATVIEISQTDALGNTTRVVQSAILDRIAPTISITSPTPTTLTNNDDSLSVTGTCEANINITITNAESTSVACTNGSFFFTSATVSTDATRSYTFQQTDAAGNSSTALSVVWTRDTSAPAFTVTSSNPYIHTGVAASISGACVTGTDIVVTGSETTTVTCIAGAYTYAPAEITDAERSYTLSQTDSASNSTSVTVTTVRDTTAPTGALVSINSGDADFLGSTVTISHSASESLSDPIEICIKNGAVICNAADSWTDYETSTTNWTVDTPTVNGLKTITVSFRDQAGNISSTSDDIIKNSVMIQPYIGTSHSWLKHWQHNRSSGSTSATACDGTESSGATTCTVSGPLLLAITEDALCSGLSMSDALSVFSWSCAEVNGVAQFTGRLLPNKGLRDLITFAGTTWTNNSVTLLGSSVGGGTHVSTPSAWWSNTIRVLPDNSVTCTTATGFTCDTTTHVANLNEEDSIYVLSSSQGTRGYNIAADQIAVVTAATAVISPSATLSTNCSYTSGESTNVDQSCLFSAGSQKFLWLEINAHGLSTTVIPNYILTLLNTRSSTIWNSSLASGKNVLNLRNTEDVFVHGSKLSNATQGANLLLESSSNIRFNQILATNSSGHSISIINSTQTAWNQIISSNAANSYAALSVAGSTYNSFIGVTAGNSTTGILEQFGAYNLFQTLLISNTGSYGIRALNNSYDTWANLFAFSNTGTQVSLSNTINNSFLGIVSGTTGGALSCSVSGGTTPGLTESASTCTASGDSNFTAINNPSTVGAFAESGTPAIDITQGSPALPFAYASIISTPNFLLFDDFFRFWGNTSAGAFPDTSHRGRCSGASSCAILTWALTTAASDLHRATTDGIADQDSAYPNTWEDPCPATLDWSKTLAIQNGATTHWQLAEVLGDETGDEDGLCESNESCEVIPNFGGYQGHGSRVLCTPSGVTGNVEPSAIWGWGTNGY